MSRKKVTDSETFLGFSSRLRKIRGSLSQEEFGEIFGVTKVTISRYEAGRIPDVRTLKKLADYGGVTVDWLLKGQEIPLATREHAPELYQATPAELDVEVLTRIIISARRYLRLQRQRLSDSQEARLIADLYCYWLTEKIMPDQQVIHAYLPLAKRPS